MEVKIFHVSAYVHDIPSIAQEQIPSPFCTIALKSGFAWDRDENNFKSSKFAIMKDIFPNRKDIFTHYHSIYSTLYCVLSYCSAHWGGL